MLLSHVTSLQHHSFIWLLLSISCALGTGLDTCAPGAGPPASNFLDPTGVLSPFPFPILHRVLSFKEPRYWFSVLWDGAMRRVPEWCSLEECSPKFHPQWGQELVPGCKSMVCVFYKEQSPSGKDASWTQQRSALASDLATDRSKECVDRCWSVGHTLRSTVLKCILQIEDPNRCIQPADIVSLACHCFQHSEMERFHIKSPVSQTVLITPFFCVPHHWMSWDSTFLRGKSQKWLSLLDRAWTFKEPSRPLWPPLFLYVAYCPLEAFGFITPKNLGGGGRSVNQRDGSSVQGREKIWAAVGLGIPLLKGGADWERSMEAYISPYVES